MGVGVGVEVEVGVGVRVGTRVKVDAAVKVFTGDGEMVGVREGTIRDTGKLQAINVRRTNIMEAERSMNLL